MTKEIVLDSREQWLAERKNGVGGSDAGAIIGVDKFRGAAHVYAAKVGDVTDDAGEAAEWGNLLEPVVREKFRNATGFQVQYDGSNRIYVDEQRPWMRMSPDGFVVENGERGVLQVKTSGKKWEKIPDSYLAQVHHEMLVTGLKYAYLVTLFGSPGFHMDYVRVNLQDALADVIIDQEKAFWHDHVVPRVPPPAKTPDEVSAVLSTMRMVEGKRVRLPPEFDEIAALTKDLKANKKELEAVIAEKEAAIKLAIGDAEIGETDAGTVWTYREQVTEAYTVPGRRSRVLRRRGER